MNNLEKEYYFLIKKKYDMLAPIYDIITLPFLILHNRVVNSAKPENNSRILDIATGTGGQAYAFSKRGYKVIGIDISVRMIKIANRKNRYGKAWFLIADSKNLPFKNDSFDIASIAFALHEMPSTIREETLNEMLRVIKSNGSIIIVDFSLTKMILGKLLINYFIRFFEDKFYSEFIKSGLYGIFRKIRIEIIEEIPIMSGALKILKGRKKI